MTDHKAALEHAKQFSDSTQNSAHANLCRAYLELAQRIKESQEQEPVGYRCEWPTSWGDSDDYLSVILIERNSIAGVADYQVALKLGFKLDPLYSAPPIPPTQQEAIDKAVAEEKIKILEKVASAYPYTCDVHRFIMSFAEAIRKGE